MDVAEAIRAGLIPYLTTRLLIRLDRTKYSYTEIYKVTKYYLDRVEEIEEEGEMHFYDII